MERWRASIACWRSGWSGGGARVTGVKSLLLSEDIVAVCDEWIEGYL